MNLVKVTGGFGTNVARHPMNAIGLRTTESPLVQGNKGKVKDVLSVNSISQLKLRCAV